MWSLAISKLWPCRPVNQWRWFLMRLLHSCPTLPSRWRHRGLSRDTTQSEWKLLVQDQVTSNTRHTSVKLQTVWTAQRLRVIISHWEIIIVLNPGQSSGETSNMSRKEGLLYFLRSSIKKTRNTEMSPHLIFPECGNFTNILNNIEWNNSWCNSPCSCLKRILYWNQNTYFILIFHS